MASGLSLSVKRLSIPTSKLEETAKRIALEKKYWELKIIFSALESVVTTDYQNNESRIPKDVLEYLRKVVIISRIPSSTVTCSTTTTSENNGSCGVNQAADTNEHSNSNNFISVLMQNHKPPIDPEVRKLIYSLLCQEIRRLAETFVKIHVEKLKESPLEDDKLELKSFAETNFPLGQVLQMMVERKKQEETLDKKIAQLEKLREHEYSKYEKELEEVRGMMNRLVGVTLKTEKPEAMEQYLSHLTEQSNKINAENEDLREQQFTNENPPEIITEMDKEYKKLVGTTQILMDETTRLKEIIKIYEDLGPEFRELLANYEEIEEEIQTKEWVIKQLNSPVLNLHNNMDDSSMDDSAMSFSSSLN